VHACCSMLIKLRVAAPALFSFLFWSQPDMLIG